MEVGDVNILSIRRVKGEISFVIEVSYCLREKIKRSLYGTIDKNILRNKGVQLGYQNRLLV